METTKVQANVDRETVRRVNQSLSQLGLNQTAVINALYHAIDNQGELPFKLGLTESQKIERDMRKAFENAPVIKITNAEELNRAWDDADNE